MATVEQYRCGCKLHPIAGFITRCAGNLSHAAIEGIGKNTCRRRKLPSKESADAHSAATKEDKQGRIRGLVTYQVADILP